MILNKTPNIFNVFPIWFKRLGFDPWVGKIPLSRKRPPTPVFLPGESQGQRSLMVAEWDTTEATWHSIAHKMKVLHYCKDSFVDWGVGWGEVEAD